MTQKVTEFLLQHSKLQSNPPEGYIIFLYVLAVGEPGVYLFNINSS